MTDTLLVEIGVEELPAIPFLKELPNIKNRWLKILEKYSLSCEVEFFYTPRRLVFLHDKFSLKQDDTTLELFGAPLAIAYKDDEPTNATLGFAKKCGVDISELSTIDKGGKEVLYYKKTVEGKESKELIGLIVDEFLSSLEFGKSMRWGDQKRSFIRPIRWIGALQGSEVVEFELFGVKSSNETYTHRANSHDGFKYSSIDEYLTILENGSVILNADTRRDMIVSGFEDIEREFGVIIERDDELLEEVVAITEYPTALIGKFDSEFLRLPNEVVITSMKEHQRYFPIFVDGKLTNRFIVVSNALSDNFSHVIAGNEKVLKPRLSDGIFFYENDLKAGLNPKGLDRITFIKGLGSIYDKELREQKIAKYLNSKYHVGDEELLQETVLLSKADLITDMVYEFTELQGLMGYYYAKSDGKDEQCYMAIKEQYLPTGEDSALPSSDFSSVVALSNKLDTILGLFSINKIPTGTKDPFALRRACVGIMKIIIDRGFSFSIKDDLEALSCEYDKFDLEQLENFFIDRLYSLYTVNSSVIKAVLNSGERDLVQIDKKIKALSLIVDKDDFSEIFSTFKRVANIVKDVELSSTLEIDKNLFLLNEESELYIAYNSLSLRDYSDYESELEALFGLKNSIDNFFDNVMVNDKDEKIKNNRKNLIATIYRSFFTIADIKEISI